MSEEKFYDAPSNRVVCVFDERSSAVQAKAALIEFGYSSEQVRTFDEKAASDIDRSAKWFADTDVQMKKFERELRSGATIVSLPVNDGECREEVHRILSAHDARHVTHFGEWITEVMR